jgi:hypothetical protein
VKYWSKEFEWGSECIEDDLRPGRSAEATALEKCHNSEDLYVQDRCLKILIIAGELLVNVSERSFMAVLLDCIIMSQVRSL